MNKMYNKRYLGVAIWKDFFTGKFLFKKFGNYTPLWTSMDFSIPEESEELFSVVLLRSVKVGLQERFYDNILLHIYVYIYSSSLILQ